MSTMLTDTTEAKRESSLLKPAPDMREARFSESYVPRGKETHPPETEEVANRLSNRPMCL